MHFSLASAAAGLIKLRGLLLLFFFSAFTITSNIVSELRTQKYFAESSSCKIEMVNSMDLAAFWKFIDSGQPLHSAQKNSGK